MSETLPKRFFLGLLFCLNATGQILINEFLPIMLSSGGKPEQTHQWVELYNSGSQPINVGGWQLTDRAGIQGGRVKTLPNVTIPVAGYLVVHIAIGPDQLTFGVQGAHVYTGEAAGTFFWNPDRDDIALYSPQGIRDYVAWAGAASPFASARAHTDAVGAAIWSPGAFLNRDQIQASVGDRYRRFEAGDSVGRDQKSRDRNLARDFDVHGGVDSWELSPGNRNSVAAPLGGGAPVNALPRAAGPVAEWTFLYYLNGENSLETPIIQNAYEIQNAGGSTAAVNHVVLLDTKKYATIYGRVEAGFLGRKDIPPTMEEDMGNPSTLAEFIARAKVDFPAQKYALLLAGHGDSWKGYGPDESSQGTRDGNGDGEGDGDNLFMEELGNALAGQKFELIVFDACMMAGVEVAYQIRANTRYLVASEEIIPGNGMNYSAFVRELNANPGWDGRQLGSRIVGAYIEKYPARTKLTLSLIETDQTRELTLALDQWARLMHKNLNLHNERGNPADNVQAAIRRAAVNARRFHDDNFTDILDFAERVWSDPNAECVKAPIARVLAALQAAVIVNRTSADVARAGGLHVHFPVARSAVSGDVLLFGGYDLPDTRYRSGDTSLVSYAPNNYALPLRVRDAETKQPFAVTSRISGVDQTQTLVAPGDFLSLKTPGFLYVIDTFWDEFLDRYYHPVAEVRAVPGPSVFIQPLGGGACENVVDYVVVPSGGAVTFSGAGSSDDENQTPSYFFWDGDADTECSGICVAPHGVSPGQPAHEATDNIDADRELADGPADDVDGRLTSFVRNCPSPTPAAGFIVTLHVWDQDHLAPFHDTSPSAEYVHPQSDSWPGHVQCTPAAANLGTSAQPPFTQTGERVLMDIAAVSTAGARLVNFPMTVVATNLMGVTSRDVTSTPSSGIGRGAASEAGRAADVVVPTGTATTILTNKQGFATLDFTYGAPGAASLQITASGLPTATIPYSVVARLAPPADEIVVTPPAGPLTVGQDYTLLVDAKRNGAPLGDAVVAFTNPPGSSGTAEMRNGTLFRTNFGSQSRTGATSGRTNVSFRPVANGPVEIMVISGTIVKIVSMTASGGPTRAADKIQVVDAPTFARVNEEVAVRWMVKALEAPVAGVAVQVLRDGAAAGSIQTDATGVATFRIRPAATGVVRLSAATSGVTLPAVVNIPVLPPAASAGPVTVVRALNNGPSGDPKVSPGGLFSIYGENLASATLLTSTTPWPRTMGSARVTVNGVDAPLYYVSPTQINGQIPYETATGNASAVITVGTQAPVSVTFPVVPAKPGVMVFNGNRAVVVNQNGAVNTSNTAAAGGEVGIVYFSGIGVPDTVVATGAGAPAAEPLARAKYPAAITINGAPVQVFYLGLAPTYPALAQANFRFPSLPPGDYPLVITVNGEDSNAALISIR